MGSMLAMTTVQFLMAWLLIILAGLLMLVILVQRGRGQGLSGAFGGGGGGSNAVFGAKTGDVFTWITVGLAAVLILMVVVAVYAFDMGSVQPVNPGVGPATNIPAADGDTTAPAGDGATGDDTAADDTAAGDAAATDTAASDTSAGADAATDDGAGADTAGDEPAADGDEQ